MHTIKSATELILSIENLRTKQELDNWCGDRGKQKLYDYVRAIAPEHWNRIATPTHSVRFYYQKMLTGYRRFND